LRSHIDTLVEDFFASRLVPVDSELAQVEAAMYLEECFGVRITDAEIAPETLGNPEAIRRFLRAKVGG